MMKKILLIAIVVLLLASLSLTIYAFTASPSPSPGRGNGAFQSSPSANRAPDIIGGSSDNEHCEINNDKSCIIIVPYNERKTLPDGGELMEEAYWTIADVKSLGELGGDMERLLAMCMVKDGALWVADLFEMHHECDETKHGEIRVQFRPKNIGKIEENFASVIHYEDGEWKIVKSTISDDGTITIVTDNLEGPFAIVVHDGSGMSPQDAALIAAVLALVAGVLSLILIALIFKKKRID